MLQCMLPYDIVWLIFLVLLHNFMSARFILFITPAPYVWLMFSWFTNSSSILWYFYHVLWRIPSPLPLYFALVSVLSMSAPSAMVFFTCCKSRYGTLHVLRYSVQRPIARRVKYHVIWTSHTRYNYHDKLPW